MDRIIKFRVWDTYYQKMTDSFFMFDVRDGEYIYYNSYRDFEDGRDLSCKVMQFTGLYDCEGKEIWEGDVIEYTQHHFNTELVKVKRKVVKWNYDHWNIYETAAGETDVKVLGNIYEHPQLLNNENN